MNNFCHNSFSCSCFDQFEIIRLISIHPFGNFDISVTNSTVFIFLSVFYVIFLYETNIKNGFLVPRRYQTIFEGSYETFHAIIKDQSGSEGYRFFPFILSSMATSVRSTFYVLPPIFDK